MSFYQTLEDLIDVTSIGPSPPERFDASCFNGEYVTNDIDVAYLEMLRAKRNDGAKKTSAPTEVVGLHNGEA